MTFVSGTVDDFAGMVVATDDGVFLTPKVRMWHPWPLRLTRQIDPSRLFPLQLWIQQILHATIDNLAADSFPVPERCLRLSGEFHLHQL